MTDFRLSILIAALYLALVPTPAAADQSDTERFLDQWARHMEGVTTLEVRFEQTRNLRILRQPRVSQGVAYLKGTRLFMAVEGTGGQAGRRTELLVEDDTVRLHHPALNRLEIYHQQAGRPHAAPLPIFGGEVRKLTEQYRVSLVEEAGDPVLVLEPRPGAEGGSDATVRLRFKDYQVVELDQRSPGGDQTVLRITRFLRNPDIPDEKLRLAVPEGTRVVHFPPQDEQ